VTKNSSLLGGWLTRGRLVTALVIAAVIAIVSFRATRPAELALVEPVQREVVEVVVASGRLRAVRQSQVGAEAAGVVEQLEVREGDRVERGQRLGALRLGEVPARLAQSVASQEAASRTLESEEAALRRAEQELARSRELAARKLVAAVDLERAETDLEVQRGRTQASRARLREAAAEIERVRPEFGRREVRAPFDGVIVQRLVEPGTSVSSSTAWFVLAEMDAVELYVETDENNLGKLAVGQSAIAIAPAYPDKPFDARLIQIGPNVDTERGVVGLRLAAESVPAFTLPNMTVDVNVEVRRTPSSSALPASSVGAGAPPFVLLRGADGRLVSTPVQVLGRNPEWVAVAGLPEGARVLRNVREGKAGQRVRD
jgi:HlyD family secretion protein